MAENVQDDAQSGHIPPVDPAGESGTEVQAAAPLPSAVPPAYSEPVAAAPAPAQEPPIWAPQPPAAGHASPPPPPAPSVAPPTKSGVGKAVAASALVALLVGGASGYAGYQLADKSDASSTPTSSTSLSIPAADLSERSDNSVATIASRMLPTVVSIDVKGTSQEDIGSGFIVRSDGYIVTNNHVVAAAANGGDIEIKFNDGTTKPAQIVGTDASYDLAVLKVDAKDLPVASIGNSDNIKVGDLVVAVGSPLGYSGTVTSGIVSALNRPVTPGGDSQSSGGSNETAYISAIQTDAAINPGNSGGPLVNAAAEVIGVNAAMAASSGSSEGSAGSIGLGFAIPSNTAKRIVEEIIAGGKAATPIIGINISGGTSTNAPASGGATVGSVQAGGPAEKAGIKQGDVIIAVNGTPVDDATGLITLIRSKAPGDTVKLTVKTGDTTREVQVTLGTKSN